MSESEKTPLAATLTIQRAELSGVNPRARHLAPQ